MPSKDAYPRVLLVLMTKVKADDPSNLLIRTQFGEWPKDHLAQIHAMGNAAGHGELCGSYYRLQACDRFLGGLFRKLRRGVFEMVAADEAKRRIIATPEGVLGRWGKVVKKRIGDWLIGSGLWEVVFRVLMSKPMARFIEEFKPDLVYCQGYSLGFATLPLLIKKRFKIPICFQTTDDWPRYTYRSSPISCLLRRKARKLMIEAKVRMAFGEKMRRLYEHRYDVRFEATYHLDDPNRFPKESKFGTEPIQIVYTGSIGLRRYEAVQDLLQAVRSLQDHGRPIQIELYCSGLPKDTPRELYDAPEVKFLPLPTHDELPIVLASASVLFLPESFSVAPELIEHAISTKAHLYMMSSRPILVYGPAYSGTVEYAVEAGWAAVLAERNHDRLKELLWKLLHDRAWNAELSRKARVCAQKNHDLITGRERFCKLLAEAALHPDINRESELATLEHISG